MGTDSHWLSPPSLWGWSASLLVLFEKTGQADRPLASLRSATKLQWSPPSRTGLNPGSSNMDNWSESLQEWGVMMATINATEMTFFFVRRRERIQTGSSLAENLFERRDRGKTFSLAPG